MILKYGDLWWGDKVILALGAKKQGPGANALKIIKEKLEQEIQEKSQELREVKKKLQDGVCKHPIKYLVYGKTFDDDDYGSRTSRTSCDIECTFCGKKAWWSGEDCNKEKEDQAIKMLFENRNWP